MIIGLSTQADATDISVELVVEPLSHFRKRVLYEPSLNQLRTYVDEPHMLLIPCRVADTNYDFRTLIAHVRLDPQLCSWPITVIVGDSEDDLRTWRFAQEAFLREWYPAIDVTFDGAPDVAPFPSAIDPRALELYRQFVTAQPLDGGGRHDQANRWGAYVLMRALDASGLCRAGSEKSMIRSTLLQDPFYRARIQGLDSGTPDPKVVTDLRSAYSRYVRSIGNVDRILIVEDQLADGWEAAYTCSLGNIANSPELAFARTAAESKQSFNSRTSLVLLDVRLDVDRDDQCQDETFQDSSRLSGVRLAKWFQENSPGIPIVAATASNKSWTLEALLKNGANSYWVKDGPDISRDINQAMRNLTELYNKVAHALDWSKRTRSWIQSLHTLAQVVGETNSLVGKRLVSKARSLQALLYQAFSPFSRELSDGLQMNLAFAVTFSCMNDFVTWALRVESDLNGHSKTWLIDTDNGPVPIVSCKEKTHSYNGRDDRDYEYLLHDDRRGSTIRHDFPDVEVALLLLNQGLRLPRAAADFRELSRTRNSLPIIHGKVDPAVPQREKFDRVDDSDISKLIAVFESMVHTHQGNLAQLQHHS